MSWGNLPFRWKLFTVGYYFWIKNFIFKYTSKYNQVFLFIKLYVHLYLLLLVSVLFMLFFFRENFQQKLNNFLMKLFFKVFEINNEIHLVFWILWFSFWGFLLRIEYTVKMSPKINNLFLDWNSSHSIKTSYIFIYEQVNYGTEITST